MYKVNISTRSDIRDAYRDLGVKVKRRFNTNLRTMVKPAIHHDVMTLLAPYPGPVKLPFKFATDKSRRAYFATNGFGHGIPYQRTNQTHDSWDVRVIERRNDYNLKVVNLKPSSKYVYGPRQVPGHRNTGWGKEFNPALELITEHADSLLIDAWGDAVYGSIGVR